MRDYRRMVSRQVGTVCLAAVLVALNGCGGSDLPDGPTGTVKGRITYKGQPCPSGAIVMFVHNKSGIAARGIIGDDGEYSLTMRGGDLVLAGDYEISIMPPPEDAETSRAVESGQPLTAEQKEFLSRKWEEIPLRYRQPTTSGERFTVEPGENTYDLDMKDGPAPKAPSTLIPATSA